MSWAHRKLVPASGAGRDFREIEAERVKTRGNVTAAARRFGVPPQDLRKLAWSTELANTIYEALDEAQQVVRVALKSDDKAVRLQAAKAMLTQTLAGKRRGWGSGAATLDKP